MKKSHLTLLAICIFGGGTARAATHSSARTVNRENVFHATKEKCSSTINQKNSAFKAAVEDENIFDEDFSNGLSGWAAENASIKTYNNQPYAFLDGSGGEHEVGAIQKNITGTKEGAKYRLIIIGSGHANVSVDSSGYPIIINTGEVDMSEQKAYVYQFTATQDDIQLSIISYGVASGIGKITIDKI